MASSSEKSVVVSSGSSVLLPANGRVIAVVVGVENYQKGRFSAVSYAEADANAFSDVLRDMYDEGAVDCELMLSAEATKQTLDYQISQAIQSTTAEDLFVFFYAGHGFFASGDNYLTAFDSATVNVSETSIPLMTSLVEPLRNSACRRALLFVDACATKVASRATISSFDSKQVQLPEGNKDEYHALFLSCQRGQSSYPAPAERHGVWTFHLLKALQGRAKEALADGTNLTDISLRDYLQKSVTKYIRDNTMVSGKQTPEALIRASSSFVIRSFPTQGTVVGDVPDLSMLSAPLREVYFEGTIEGRVKQLPGFNKTKHSVPYNNSSASRNFVAKSAWPMVEEDIDSVYASTKDAFSLKRRDISTSRSESDASGMVDCEYFRYSVVAEQNADNVEQYIITRHLKIREPDDETITKCSSMFGSRVDRLVIEVDNRKWDFDELVEQFEELKDHSEGTLREDETNGIIDFRASSGMHIEVQVHVGRIVLATGNGTLINLLEVARELTFGLTGPSMMKLR